jgi:cell division protein FtsB
MTITTEEAERLARLSRFADHLQTLQYKEMRQLITDLAAERDALRAERNAEVGHRLKAEGALFNMERRIARQRRALAKLYKRRHDRKAEVERPESGVSYETFVSAMRIVTTERDALRAENARLREAMEMARDCIDDKDVIGAKQTLTLALGETQ